MLRQAYLLFILAAFVSINTRLAWGSPASYYYNGVSSGNSVNSFNFNINTNTYTINGKCVQEITVFGRGVRDTFPLPCSQDGMDMLNLDNLLIIGNPKKNAICLYSDGPSSLIIIENGRCTKKTYTTTNGQTTSTWSPISQAMCSDVQKNIEVEQEKNRKEWENWSNNFEQEMVDSFPPGFPFDNQHQTFTGSQHNFETNYENYQPHGGGYDEKPSKPYGGSSADSSGSNYGPETSEVGSAGWWEVWNKNFAEKMRTTMSKAFPPGFPFNNN